LKTWRIVLVCCLLAVLGILSADAGQPGEERLIRKMLESYANAVTQDGRSHGSRVMVVWSSTPAEIRGITPLKVTLKRKLREDLWEASVGGNRAILMKVTRIHAAPALEENRSYVIPDMVAHDEEPEKEIRIVKGDLILPPDAEDP